MKKQLLLFILALLCLSPLARGQATYPTSFSNGGNIRTASSNCDPSACVGIGLPGPTAAVLTVGATGTWSGTLVVEESQDGGFNFTSAGANITSNGTTSYVIAGFTQFRVRASTLSSGMAGVNLQVSTAPSGGVTSGTADPTGNACAPNSVYVQTATGNFYTCKAGVFAIVGPTTASVGCQSSCTYVLTTADQEWVQPSAGNALAAANTTQLIKFYNNATRGLGNACFRLGGTGSAGGHIDIGVYSITGTLLWHTGPQLTTTANANFCVTPTPVTLAAGTNYYIAWTEDNNVATLVASANVITLWGTINLSGAPAHTFGIDTTDATTGGTLLNTITPNNIVNTNAVIVPYVQVFL